MYKRSLQPKLENVIAVSPVTLLTGPRQSGKTTLVKEIAEKYNFSYVTFDDLNYLSSAKNDPIGFIAGIKKPVIIDEVQRVPEIFLAIKQDVDENRHAGRYLLTGSANPLLIPRLGDSLAGRMIILNLYSLSQGELQNKYERFIEHIFSNEPLYDLKWDPISKDDLFRLIDIGGYPSVQNLDCEQRELWFNSYITTILYRDVQELANITGLTEFPQLLKLLATRVGNLLNVAELSRSIGIPTPTLHRYLALLETLFMTKFQPAHSGNLGKRLVKAPKINFFDTGFLSYLIDHNFNALGGVLENFVFSQLVKQATWCKNRVNIFHYRSVNGIEIDIILEDAAGNVVAIEVKSAQTVTPKDFKGLEHLANELGDKFIKGIVLYTGANFTPFGKKLFALPVSALWS
jgi:predicted AAA+ superfamily ATPase